MNGDAAQAPYVGSGGVAYHEGKRALPPIPASWVCRVRARRWQSRLGPQDHIFELGCGFGWNLAALRCARRVGQDIATELASIVTETGVEFVSDPGVLAAESFHRVLCHHALEHVGNPLATLQQLHRLTRRDGQLWLVVPYERERRYRRFDPAEPNHHLFSWNPQTLGNLVAVAGWQVETVGLAIYGYDRRAALWAQRWNLGERGFLVLRRLLQTLRPLQEVSLVARRASP